ncbi:helix-turn-helix domain-containing protein [Maribacter sp. 2-571]|uniref:helix-turn-helix domain-containing protein n=1 Tax=Maribacter sp. 2-571 TaxID=3417569 RepID=UPI003D33B2AF
MKENIPINVKLVLKRIKEELGISKDLELCERLGVKQTTFSSWRSRETIDFRLVLEFAHRESLNLEYVLFGTQKKDNTTTEAFLSLLVQLVSDKMESKFEKQNELHEKLLFMLEKEDIRRQLEDARKQTDSNYIAKKGSAQGRE